MKKIITSLIIILASIADANAIVKDFVGIKFHEEVFVVEKKKVAFSASTDRRIIIHSRCLTQNCLAIDVLKAASVKAIEKEISGGMNPGALVCKKLKGKVILGFDLKENQNSFCRFDDGSLIDNGTLVHYGMKNDHQE